MSSVLTKYAHDSKSEQIETSKASAIFLSVESVGFVRLVSNRLIVLFSNSHIQPSLLCDIPFCNRKLRILFPTIL